MPCWVSECQKTLPVSSRCNQLDSFPLAFTARQKSSRGQAPYEIRAFQYIWFNKQHDESIKRKRFKAGSVGIVMGGIFFNDKTAFKLALYDFTGLCHFENITTGEKIRVTRRPSSERF
jgi:hypothetical protein